MNIVIDAGNTFVKLGVCEGDTLLEMREGLTPEAAVEACAAFRPEHILISSVGLPADTLQTALRNVSDWVRIFDYTTPLPIINHYETPQTLGTDRLAAVMGARHLYPGEACLAIDMGTCITYDFITADNHYLGGSISPGLRMRLRAMHSFTSRLPMLEPAEADLIGRNTRQAMLSGAVQGMAAEVSGIVQAYGRMFPAFKTLACGGDAPFFETRIKEPIFVVPSLVLIGLNSILQYNLSL